ncbi:BrnT family toxin [Mannheimia sp. AT1]|uniref:BrnT family toxin n=1 Tax=Mannheimia cairinae TaxID=3025936 RepID=A0ABT5MP05_9PAST|nr:BrnT family toxin [Mannheimia cairinae]MDD0823902.1 BrnT family toxin [Mannheimia cairinae]MDD0825218.1 BrnT family toxin [Mannheimia cairinae]
MNSIDGFEWDRNKALLNLKKHNVTFMEATTVFYDDNAILILDPDHSDLETRFLLLGMSNTKNLLVVVHCERDRNIRIISARKATSRETVQYRRRH